MLGDLSRQYESGGKAAAIGYDSTGGWSYGLYQIATLTGTMGLFLVWLQGINRGAFDRLMRAGGVAGAKEGKGRPFAAVWSLLSASPEFVQNQHDYIRHSHYDGQVARVRAAGIDPEQRSAALRDVIWSVAVQHGAMSDVITDVIAEHGAVADAQLIPLIYAERRTRFGRSTSQVRAAVMRRFDSEMAEAMGMLGQPVAVLPVAVAGVNAAAVPPVTQVAKKPSGLGNDNDRSKYL